MRDSDDGDGPDEGGEPHLAAENSSAATGAANPAEASPQMADELLGEVSEFARGGIMAAVRAKEADKAVAAHRAAPRMRNG